LNITLLKAKIHRATVTETELDYMGSVSIDSLLMEAAGLYEYERILVVNIATGARFETYCIKGERGSGIICVNGAAARLALKGDKVIIMAFCELLPEEASTHKPKVVFVDENNAIIAQKDKEEHGRFTFK
jgi:aspartate 1-decarboxylase